MERDILIKAFPRLKKTVPFSQRLNDYIENWFEVNKNNFIFTEEDDFDAEDIEGTLQKHIQRYKETGKIHIWKGASDNTIFGSEEINFKFRAWHDYLHIMLERGYDFVGETIVAEAQKAMLPVDWHFERELIGIEIVGQAIYFMEHGEFLINQRTFTIEYLKNPQCFVNKQ